MEAQIVKEGVRVPTFIYGTAWKEEATERLTTLALEAGFTGIDTANQRRHYFEEAVGAALSRACSTGRLHRKDVFLQTKFTYARGQDHRLPYDPSADHRTQVRQSFESSLAHLRTDAIDSFVLHGPSTSRGLAVADLEVWSAMEEIAREGRTKLLGVSNVDRRQLEMVCEAALVQPAFVQNRCYARTGWDREVRALCRERQILYQGFSLLTANPQVLSHLEVRRIARRVQKNPAQVVFRFALQIGMLPLTGTSDPAHMREDLAVYDFALEDEDVALIESLGSATG